MNPISRNRGGNSRRNRGGNSRRNLGGNLKKNLGGNLKKNLGGNLKNNFDDLRSGNGLRPGSDLKRKAPPPQPNRPSASTQHQLTPGVTGPGAIASRAPSVSSVHQLQPGLTGPGAKMIPSQEGAVSAPRSPEVQLDPSSTSAQFTSNARPAGDENGGSPRPSGSDDGGSPRPSGSGDGGSPRPSGSDDGGSPRPSSGSGDGGSPRPSSGSGDGGSPRPSSGSGDGGSPPPSTVNRSTSTPNPAVSDANTSPLDPPDVDPHLGPREYKDSNTRYIPARNDSPVVKLPADFRHLKTDQQQQILDRRNVIQQESNRVYQDKEVAQNDKFSAYWTAQHDLDTEARELKGTNDVVRRTRTYRRVAKYGAVAAGVGAVATVGTLIHKTQNSKKESDKKE